MPTPSHTLVCTSKEFIAPGTVELRFSKPEGFTFMPGQFLLFDVPLIGNPTDLQPRAYSIASTPEEDDLLFVVKLIPGGRFSRYCEEMLAVNDELTAKGPLGRFVIDPLPDAHIILLATGAGMAPNANINAAVVTEINRLVPNVQIVPPQGYLPGQLLRAQQQAQQTAPGLPPPAPAAQPQSR